MTAAHNAIRCALPTSTPLPPLQWSSTLAATAQAWADSLAANNCASEHSTTQYGENIAWSQPPMSPPQVVDEWVDPEIGCFSNGPFDSCSCTCGHYSQIVWRGSTEVGCGAAECDGGLVWVCNYNPAGNFLGEQPY
jgi:pathogenesis-related protein 1